MAFLLKFVLSKGLTNETAVAFQKLGWTPRLDVDRYAEKDLGDRIVHVLFKVKELGDCQKFEASFSIKSAEFTTAVKEVEGGRGEYNDLLKVSFKDKVRFQESAITQAHIQKTCDSAVQWAKSVDINRRYEELCGLEPSTPGAAGVWHLAALSIMRRIETLVSYQERFEAGDNCGFVPYITKDYIDRAVAMAK